MRNPVLVASVAAGKASAAATRLLGRGGGTALPGLVAHAVYPRVLRDLTAQLPDGSVMVTGTNGKTTTSRMLGSILEVAGMLPLHNRSGSNLERGLIATMVGAATASAALPGQLRVGLFEVDEATVPAVLPSIRPRVAVFNNLFRDQLDRYGEIDTVYNHWRSALPRLSSTSTIVLNVDDPAIAYLSSTCRSARQALYLRYKRQPLLPGSATPRCQLYLLPALQQPPDLQPDIVKPPGPLALSPLWPGATTARRGGNYVQLHGTESSELRLQTPVGEMTVTLKVPGLYNVYNGLAAISWPLPWASSPKTSRRDSTTSQPPLAASSASPSPARKARACSWPSSRTLWASTKCCVCSFRLGAGIRGHGIRS